MKKSEWKIDSIVLKRKNEEYPDNIEVVLFEYDEKADRFVAKRGLTKKDHEKMKKIIQKHLSPESLQELTNRILKGEVEMF